MVFFSNKMFLVGCVTVTLLIGIQFQSAEGLKCWTCSGYDEQPNQCSPENDGTSVQCGGSTPFCELVVETHSGGSLDGHVYLLRKCVDGSASKSGTCDAPKTENGITKVHCYCNDKDDCNKAEIAGRGLDGGGGGGSSGEESSGALTVIVIVIIVVVVALVVGGGLGYRWYSGRSRRTGMEVSIPSED